MPVLSSGSGSRLQGEPLPLVCWQPCVPPQPHAVGPYTFLDPTHLSEPQLAHLYDGNTDIYLKDEIRQTSYSSSAQNLGCHKHSIHRSCHTPTQDEVISLLRNTHTPGSSFSPPRDFQTLQLRELCCESKAEAAS